MPRLAALAVLVASVAPVLPAQVLQILAPQPVAPDSFVPVQITNTSTTTWTIISEHPIVVLQPESGDLVGPFGNNCQTFANLTPGQTFASGVIAPSRPGSYIVYFRDGSAVARLDVGTASPTFPDSAVFAANINEPRFANIGQPDGSAWSVANFSSAPFTIAQGAVEVVTPGGTTPLYSWPFDGTTVQPNRVEQVPLFAPGTPPGTYTIRARWIEPTTGRSRVFSSGLQEAPVGLAASLQLPEGRDVVAGGSIAVRAVAFDPNTFGPTQHDYVVLLGIAPGFSPLATSYQDLPLLGSDPLVIASLQNGVGGLIANGIGRSSTQAVQCAPRQTIESIVVDGVRIQHHGVPGLGPFRARVAIVLREPQGSLYASQSEEITFR